MEKKRLYNILFIILVLSGSLNAQVDKEKEFIYRLIKFTHWTDDVLDSSEAFSIGVYNDEDISTKMSNFFEEKKCYNKNIKISNFTEEKTIYNYDIVFLPEKLKNSSKLIIELCSDYKIISISLNNASFCKKGGIINFVYTRDECLFQINNKAAIRNEIFFSPQLLNIAEIIK